MSREVWSEVYDYLKTRYKAEEHIIFNHWNDASKNDTRMQNVFSSLEKLEADLPELYRRNVVDSRAIGFAFNAFKTNANRKQDNVSRILHIVLDMDGNPHVDDYNKVVAWLDKNKIAIAFASESKNGYHIIIPVNLEVSEKPKVMQFLDNAKEVYSGIDLALKSLDSTIRLPNSFHYKDRQTDPLAAGFQLKTMEFMLPSAKEIERNSKYVQNLEIKVKEVYIENEDTEIQVTDTFFNTLLNSDDLLKKISKLQSIQKHGVLFKNLAVFVNQNPSAFSKAQKLVLMSEHSEDTLQKWAQSKTVKQVNYLELLKWAKNNKINELLPLIQKQLSQGDILTNFNFFFMVNAKANAKYKVLSKTGQIFKEPVPFTHVVETLYYLLLRDGVCLFNNYKIAPVDDKGAMRTIPAKTKILETIMRNKINNSIIAIHDEKFIPADDVVFEKNNETYLNTYTKAEVRTKELVKENQEFSNIDRVLRHICADDVNYAWMLKWLAHIMQNPTKKLPTSLVLKGGQGSGKGIFYKFVIKYLFGEENINQISSDTFKRGWGDTLQNKMFLNFDEFTLRKGADDEHIERLKSITSESVITVNIKKENSVKVDNYCHFLFTSNKSNPIPLQKDDRRYTIFYQPKAIPLDYVDAIDPAYHGELHAKEIHHFYSYLMKLPVEHKEVVKALDNQTKRDNIETNHNTVDMFLEEIKQYDDFDAFQKDYSDSFSVKKLSDYEDEGILFKGVDRLITAAALHELYVTFCHKIQVRQPMLMTNMGKELKSNEIRTEFKKKYGKRHTCYYIEDLQNNEEN